LSQFISVSAPPTPARAQDRAHGAVDRRHRAAGEIGDDLRMREVQLPRVIERVARLGDGERDDAGQRIGAEREHARERGLVGDDLGDGRDLLEHAPALRGDRLQRVGAALALQRGEGVGHVGPQVRAGALPAQVARLHQPVQVHGLVRAVERAEAQVQQAQALVRGWRQ
jgi:hypothetical protein